MADGGGTERLRSGKLRRFGRQVGPLRLVVILLLLAGALGIARYSWHIPLLDAAERALYDLRFAETVTRPAEQDRRITLVEYTDETLVMLQKRSPLDRGLLAKALTVIDQMNPKAVAIDILIDQPQAEDEQLVEALRAMRAPTFVAFITNASNPNMINYDQEQFLRAFLARVATDKVRPASVRLESDKADGVFRNWPERHPDLPPVFADAMAPELSAAGLYRGAINFRVSASEGGDDQIPLFTALPIEALAGLADLPPEDLQAVLPALSEQVAGRYILIGGNVQGIDKKNTPISRVSGVPINGLEVHAQMLRQMLDGERMDELPLWALWAAALLIVLAAAATGFLELRAWMVPIALVIQLGAIAYLPFFLAGREVGTLALPAAGWGVGWVLAFIGATVAARAVGSEQRKFAHSALGKYLPADIANEIMREPERLTLTGEKKQIFALFTDLEGFTKLSHAIPPERLSSLLNAYLDLMSDTVLEHGGTIDKFVGDAVVAFWGAPIARADDGERAAKAAVALYRAGERFRGEAEAGLPPIGVTRVGLHRGEAVVGNFGGDKRIQYTALGDGMNTAARLESANKALQTTILVSREAKDASGLDHFRPMGRVVLSGRATPVEVWEPVPDMDDALRGTLTDLWSRYDGGEQAALADLERIAAERPDDQALHNFVFRIREAGPGGHYVLASK